MQDKRLAKRERNYKEAQRRAQYGELQECTQRSQQRCSTAAIQYSITAFWGQNNGILHISSNRKDINSPDNSAVRRHSVTARPDSHFISLMVLSDKILFSCTVWQYYFSVHIPPALMSNVFKLCHMMYTPSCSSSTTFSCRVPTICSPGTTTTHRNPVFQECALSALWILPM